MLVVKIELHSAITGEVTEIGRTYIANVGGTPKRGDYEAWVMRENKIDTIPRREALELNACCKASVTNYPRLSANVWNLVARVLKSAGFK